MNRWVLTAIVGGLFGGGLGFAWLALPGAWRFFRFYWEHRGWSAEGAAGIPPEILSDATFSCAMLMGAIVLLKAADTLGGIAFGWRE